VCLRAHVHMFMRVCVCLCMCYVHIIHFTLELDDNIDNMIVYIYMNASDRLT